MPELDFHRLSAAEAVRRLELELHAARVRGLSGLVVVTGRGYGNPGQQPILRTKLEAWLSGPEARRFGVRGWKRVHREGALEIELGRPGAG